MKKSTELSQEAIPEMTLGGVATLQCGVNAWTDVSLNDLQAFTRQFALLYRAGMNIAAALEMLHEHCTSRDFKEVLGHVHLRVVSGGALSEGLKGFPKIFSPIFVGLVMAGESSGQLDVMLDRLATLLEKQQTFMGKVRAALIYPAFLVLSSILGMLCLVFLIIPRLGVMFDEMHLQLPAVTRWTLVVSQRLCHPAVVAVFLAVVGVFVFKFRPWLARQQRLNQDLDVAIHQIPLNLPIVGHIVTQIVGARLLQTLASLLDAGMPVHKALDLCGKVVGNAALAKQLRESQKSLSAGASISVALLNCDAFPIGAIHMIAAGEEAAGQLTRMMRVVADMYEQDLEIMLEQIVLVIEPLILISTSVMVGFLLCSTFYPLISLIQQL